MKLTFLEQEWSDFKAFAGQHRLRWDNPGLNFFCSDNIAEPGLTANGCGKSTVFDAWCWCLFGRTAGNLRNPDVIPWSGKDKPLVTNIFKVDDKEHYLSRRIGKLILDDKEVNQDRITDLLGLEFVLAVNTVLLAQDEDLFYDLEPSKKLGLFSDTLQLERWDTRSKRAGVLTTDYEEEKSRLEMEVSIGEDSITTLLELLTNAKADAEKWAFAARARARDVTALKEELRGRLDKKETLLGSAKLRLDGAETEIGPIQKEIKKLWREENNAIERLNESKGRIERAQVQLENLQTQLEETLVARVCPTCGQPVKAKDLEKHKDHLVTQINDLAKLVNAKVPEQLLNVPKFFADKIKVQEGHLKSFEDRADAARSEVDRLFPEVAELKAQLKEIARTAVEEENPYTASIKDLNTRIKQAQADLKECKEAAQRASLAAERNRYWIAGFKSLKLELITDVLQNYEFNTNSMIEEVGLKDWQIAYNIEQETKSGTTIRAVNVGIKSPTSRKFARWESWSGGEKQRLKLIGALSLSDTLLAAAGIETNLEILDEPASYWSAEGVQDMIAFLAARARAQGKSIYLVEHSAVESSHFARTLKVIRDQQGAYIEGNDELSR